MISRGDTIIFDLDGTLIQSTDFDDAYFKEAITEITGIKQFRKDWNDYTNVTDSGLLKEIFSDAEVEFDHVIESEIKDIFFRKMKTLFASGYQIEPILGAREMLEKLCAADIPYGIATGGWGCTAKLKMKAAGLPTPQYIASSDNAAERSKIMLECLEKMKPNENPVYFGDGEWDACATAELGWRFVGVGPRLKTKTQFWIENFQDPLILKALGAFSHT